MCMRTSRGGGTLPRRPWNHKDSNATLRAAVTALAREAPTGARQRGQKKDTKEHSAEALWRSPARCLRAMLLALIYESASLACPQCGADRRINAFVPESA
jgi:hypothetical protein